MCVFFAGVEVAAHYRIHGQAAHAIDGGFYAGIPVLGPFDHRMTNPGQFAWPYSLNSAQLRRS